MIFEKASSAGLFLQQVDVNVVQQILSLERYCIRSKARERFVMFSYGLYSSSPDPLQMTITVVILIVVLCMWVMAIGVMTGLLDESEKKLAGVSNGMMWAIGIFATPIVLGLIILAIQNKAARKANLEGSEPEDAKSNLPTV